MLKSILGLALACAILLLIAMAVIARATIAALAPVVVFVVVIVLAGAFVIGLFLAIFHALKWNDAKIERFRLQSTILFPDTVTGANYPIIYDQDSRAIIQALPGVTIQPVPAHYAPHYENAALPGARSLETFPEIDAPALMPELPRSLPFSTIIREVAPGHVCLGCGAAGAIYGDLDDLLSTAIVGRPGTGKTTLLRFVCAQVLRVEGTPILFDPHGNIADQIGGLLQCSESPQEIAQAAKELERTLDTRLLDRRQGKRAPRPILLLADEWPIIAASCAIAITVMQRIVLEGRKVGMYSLISGQGLPASLLNGTLVRDALSSRYVFNTTAQQARLAGLDNETAKAMLAILDTTGPGRAILASARLKPEVVAIPDTSVQDIRSCIVDSSIAGKRTETGNGRETYGNGNGNGRETALQAYSGDSMPTFPETGDLPVTSAFPVGNETRETIRRARVRGMPHRDVAGLVGLSGRNYATYQAVCKEEGIE